MSRGLSGSIGNEPERRFLKETYRPSRQRLDFDR